MHPQCAHQHPRDRLLAYSLQFLGEDLDSEALNIAVSQWALVPGGISDEELRDARHNALRRPLQDPAAAG